MISQFLHGMVQSPLKAISADVMLLPPHLQTEAVKAAATIQAKQGGLRRELAPEEIAQLAMTPEGCRFIAFVLTRDENPGIKQDSFTASIHDGNSADILIKLMEVSGLGKSLASPGPSGSP